MHGRPWRYICIQFLKLNFDFNVIEVVRKNDEKMKTRSRHDIKLTGSWSSFAVFYVWINSTYFNHHFSGFGFLLQKLHFLSPSMQGDVIIFLDPSTVGNDFEYHILWNTCPILHKGTSPGEEWKVKFSYMRLDILIAWGFTIFGL
jgi:hypothetical protein